MKEIGIEPGKSFDFAGLDPSVKKSARNAPDDARQLMAVENPDARARR